MLDFSKLQFNNREPVYLQIVMVVKRCVLSGVAKSGDTLPSRRELAAMLGINPNTVQKAYKIMEDDGFVVTPRNAASVLTITPRHLAQFDEELGREFVLDFIKQARSNGLNYKRVIELISRYWEEDV